MTTSGVHTSIVVSSAIILSLSDSGGPSSSQGGFAPFMYPALLQDARTMPQRSSLLSSPTTPPQLISTESLRSREQQRESVIRNNYRTSRYRDLVTMGNYPNEMPAQIGHNYHTSLPNSSFNPVQRVPIASSLPQWTASNFDSYTVPSGGDTSGFYRVAPTGHPRSFEQQPPPQSSMSASQSISTVLHPPFMHHASEAPHTILNTSRNEEDESIPLSQHIHPLRQTSARTNHTYPGPSTDSPPSAATNSQPVVKQAHRISRYSNSAHPGPSTDMSQAQPSTSVTGNSRRAMNQTRRMSCRQRPRVAPTNESGSSGSSSGTGSSNGGPSHSGSADVLIVVDDSDSDDVSLLWCALCVHVCVCVCVCVFDCNLIVHVCVLTCTGMYSCLLCYCCLNNLYLVCTYDV